MDKKLDIPITAILSPLYRACLSVALLFGLCACSVTQVPEFKDPEEPPKEIVPEVILNVNFDHKMRLYNEETAEKLDRKTLELLQTTAENVPSFMCRHIIRIYSYESYRLSEDVPIREYVLTDNNIEDIDFHFNLTLDPGQYQAVIWTDHIPQGTDKDHHYQTENFRSIHLREDVEHPGSDFSRKAFYGSATINVPEYDAPERIYADIAMTKPMAKFCILSTGFEEFINNLIHMQLSASEEEKSNGTTTPKEPSDNNGASSQGVYLNETYSEEEIKELYKGYYAEITYTGFMTSSFNVFNSLPVNSRQGVSFRTPLEQLAETDAAVLGWDYFFTSAQGTITPVSVAIYNPQGELIAQSPSFEVPLERGKLTVVKGDFLREIINSGVNMNPDFAGEYNIFI